MAKAKTAKSKGKKVKPSKAANGVATAPTFDILTLEEAAALLRVSADALRADAEKGTMPVRLIAGEWRFSPQAILTWLASATANS